MPVFHQVADVITMRKARDGAVVARGQDESIPNDNGTDVFSIAGGASGHLQGNAHEILVPGSAGHGNSFGNAKG